MSCCSPSIAKKSRWYLFAPWLLAGKSKSSPLKQLAFLSVTFTSRSSAWQKYVTKYLFQMWGKIRFCACQRGWRFTYPREQRTVFLRGRCILNVVWLLLLLIHCPSGYVFCFLLYLFYLYRQIFSERIVLLCICSMPSTHLSILLMTVDQIRSLVCATSCQGLYSSAHEGPASGWGTQEPQPCRKEGWFRSGFYELWIWQCFAI